MTNGATKIRSEYLQHLKRFYSDVRSWLPAKSFEVTQDTTWLHEVSVGRYQAPVLQISQKDRARIATLAPKGAWIIGARGRVDLVGPLDVQPILYLSAGGPTITLTTSVGGEELEHNTRPFLKGVEREGWYYIGDAQRSTARPIDRDAFLELLKRVAGDAAHDSA